MPAGAVRTPHQDQMWQQAKTAASREGHEGDWPYIQGVYQRLRTGVGGKKGRDAYRGRLKRGESGRLVLRKAEPAKDGPGRLELRSPSAPETGYRPLADSPDIAPSRVYGYLRRTYPANVLEWVRGARWLNVRHVPLSIIRMERRPGGRDPAKVESLSAAMRAGKPMEPVVLVETPGGLQIADGYHRTLAARHAGRKSITAYVAVGAEGWDADAHRRMHMAKLNKGLLLKAVATMHPHHEAVRDALRHVAGMDSDRARERNGVGFSKYDNDRGHALANATEYGDRELAHARSLVNKYRRQIPAEMHARIKATEEAKPKEPLPAGAHWITTPSKAAAPNAEHRRHILIDGEGRILGGSLPKAAQGKHLSDWWKEQKAPEPHLHQHLLEQGTAFAHHEDRTLNTGHGYQQARGRFGPEAAPGHVRAGMGRGEYAAPAGYVTVDSAFADKDRIKAIGGRWGPTMGAGKTWFLPIGRLPRLLKEFPHAEVSAKAHDAYQEWSEKQAPAKEATAPAKTTEPQPGPTPGDEPFVLPEGMNREAMSHGDLHNYQKAGVRFLLQQKRAILGHAVGLGKTIQAITAAKIAQQKENAGPFLILCPASRKYGWADEIEKFAPGTKTVVLDASLTPKRQAERWAQAETGKPDFIVTNYETLQKPELAEKLHALAPNVIADEAHKVKNRKAKTTEGFRQWERAKYAWLLTATPMPNGQPEETYTMLSHVMGPAIGSWTKFGDQHVVFEDVRTPFGTIRKPVALKNVPALRQKVATAVQIKSMTDPDVGLQLPDRRRVDVALDMAKDQQKMYDGLAAQIAEEVEGMSPEAFSQAAASVMVKLKRLEQIAIDPDLVRPAEERTGDLSPKESWAVETISDHLEDAANRGVVLFCDMRLPLDKIGDALRKQGIPVAYVTGSQSPAERQQTERDFSSGKVKAVLATSAAEEGMNLQHGGHTLIHLDAPWVPKSVTQREGRIHRQGQSSPFTTHYHVMARGSVEARKQGVIHGKARDIDALLGTHGAEDLAVGHAMSRAEVLRMLRGDGGEKPAKVDKALLIASGGRALDDTPTGTPMIKGLLLRKATAAGEHWVTISEEKHPHSPLAGRHLLLTDDGRIAGGSVPRRFYGRRITSIGKTEAFHENEAEHRQKIEQVAAGGRNFGRERLRSSIRHAEDRDLAEAIRTVSLDSQEVSLDQLRKEPVVAPPGDTRAGLWPHERAAYFGRAKVGNRRGEVFAVEIGGGSRYAAVVVKQKEGCRVYLRPLGTGDLSDVAHLRAALEGTRSIYVRDMPDDPEGGIADSWIATSAAASVAVRGGDRADLSHRRKQIARREAEAYRSEHERSRQPKSAALRRDLQRLGFGAVGIDPSYDPDKRERLEESLAAGARVLGELIDSGKLPGPNLHVAPIPEGHRGNSKSGASAYYAPAIHSVHISPEHGTQPFFHEYAHSLDTALERLVGAAAG